MANKILLNILNQGVQVWNRWRIDSNNHQIDLSDANLAGINLKDVNLINADLRRANFKNTKYNKATKWPEGFDPKKVEGLVLCN